MRPGKIRRNPHRHNNTDSIPNKEKRNIFKSIPGRHRPCNRNRQPPERIAAKVRLPIHTGEQGKSNEPRPFAGIPRGWYTQD